MALLGSSCSDTSNPNKGSANSTTNGSELSSCNFCSKVLSAFLASDNEKVALGAFSDAVSTDCPHSRWLRVIEFGDPPWAPCACEWGDLHVGKDHKFSLNRLRLDRPCSCHGQAPGHPKFPTAYFEFRSKVDELPRDRKYQIIETEDINMNYMKTWLGRCQRYHGEDCDTFMVKGLRMSQPDFLIDTVRGCLSPHRPGEAPRRYFALSYVWGQPGRAAKFQATMDNIEDLKTPGVLLSGPIALKLPKTIRDAIYLTSLLGETFVWVDSLCIVQDDYAAREKALQQMHSIYSGAVLTIIVEAGWHAEDGIRGIRELTGPPRDLGGDEVIEVVRINDDPYGSTHPQDYHMRMWTFQEYIFSKRRLIFGSGPVIWECNNARWRDDVVSEPGGALPERDHRSPKPDAYDRGYHNFKDAIKSRIPKLSDLSILLRRFNRRTLSNPTDVLSSFSGIQTMLEEHKFPDGLLYGLPEFYFDIALIWVHCYGNLLRRGPGPDFGGNPLLDNLPSWSWMGWQGGVEFIEDIEFEPPNRNGGTNFAWFGFTSPITRWFIMESPGSTSRRPVRSRWHDFRQLSLDPLPEGWGKERVSHTLLRDNNYNFSALPKCLPTYLYSHGLEPRHYWYPVPVQVSPRTEGEENKAKAQTQYLYCKTRRAFLYQVPAKDKHIIQRGYNRGASTVVIRTCRERGVGALWYSYEDRLEQKYGKLELVSIVRGYSSKIPWSRNQRS